MDPSASFRTESKHCGKKPLRQFAFNVGGYQLYRMSKPAFQIETDVARNVVHLRYLGRVTAADLEPCVEQVKALLPSVRAGFTVVTDLSELESMELECMRHLTTMMDACGASGIGTAIRVIPDPAKDIGFNILSIIHYRGGVRILTCSTLAEAEEAMKL
jgi:hypothetical protein